jgi:hypothetical protein
MSQAQLEALANSLISAPPYTAGRDLRDIVSFQFGTYVWAEKTGCPIVYAGSAKGEKGLTAA